jgi:hypothetical protein
MKILMCHDNRLVVLPSLNESLEVLYCTANRLVSLPILNDNLRTLKFENNPICEFLGNPEIIAYVNYGSDAFTSYGFNQLKAHTKTLHQFRHLYYSLRFKNQFRHWLWERVRKPMTMKKYHPNYLHENLQETDDLLEFLENW